MLIAAGYGIDTRRESTHVDRSRVVEGVVESESGTPAFDPTGGKKCTGVPSSRADTDDPRAEPRDACRYFSIDERVVAELSGVVLSPAFDSADR